jgi:3-deoxy-manno-octulosonate cytidylyltransferase (CMP-KDO synthetase)
MCQINDEDEFKDPNTIKVVVDINNNALYMSREPIPSSFKGKIGIPPLKKVNVMPFDAQFLIEISQMPPATLEVIEEIFLLRVLEYGYKIKMIMSDQITYSVDTPQDLEKVKKALKNDYLLKRYLTDMN